MAVSAMRDFWMVTAVLFSFLTLAAVMQRHEREAHEANLPRLEASR